MNRDAQRRLLIEQRLRVALRERTLTLAFQASVNLDDGSLSGVEALARWTDAQLGVVSPARIHRSRGRMRADRRARHVGTARGLLHLPKAAVGKDSSWDT